jgi:ribosomal protein L40E
MGNAMAAIAKNINPIGANHCINCGGELPLEAKFCPKCGAKIG